MAQTLASRDGAAGPVRRTSARPWVRSRTVMSSPPAGPTPRPAATASRRARWATPSPTPPMIVHSPGPEPVTRAPLASLAARANGTPSAPAIAPPAGARTSVLASADTSATVSGAVPGAAPSTSQPATTAGSAGRIGLRATGSGTLPLPRRVEMRELLHHQGRDPAAVREQHLNDSARLDQMRRDLTQADGPAQRRRHPARRHPPGDLRTLHDLGCLGRHHGTVHRLQRD